MDKSMLFLVNPKAGHADLKAKLMDIVDLFTAGGYAVTVHPTQGVGDLTKQILDRGEDYDLVVCSGGDGTLNEAASALIQLEHPPALGYIPGGTVNDMAHSLGLSQEPLQAARDILEGTVRAVDVGRFGENRWFTYVAGFGAFTDVSYETPQEDKRLLGRLAYLLKGAQTLGGIKPIPVKMEADGQIIEDDVLLGLVLSTTHVGGFKPKASLWNTASLDDGLWEVVLVRNIKSLTDLNGIGTLLMTGELDPRFFYTLQAKTVTFTFHQEVKWTLDGEFGGAVEQVNLQNCRQALKIMVPEKE